MIKNLLWFLALPLTVFAHETEILHVEEPAAVSPVVFFAGIAGVGLVAFLVWRFLLRKK